MKGCFKNCTALHYELVDLPLTLQQTHILDASLEPMDTLTKNKNVALSELA
jgi:hypothetical protein